MRRLDITPTNYRLRDFISWQMAGSLDLTPRFQRRSVWKVNQRSYLIDTLFRGLPVPIIYVRETSVAGSLEPHREIVDGQQRLRTVFLFVDPTLLVNDSHYVTQGLDPRQDAFAVKRTHNKEIGGRGFEKLDDAERNAILDYRVPVQILPVDTEDSEILEIFARLNSTGTNLNPQELRNAAWFGEFKTAAYSLAYEQLDRWRYWSIFNEDEIARMFEVELVSDLMAMMLRGVSGRTKASLDKLYKDFDEKFISRAIVERRFRATMDAIEGLGIDIAESSFTSPNHFYSLFVLTYEVLFGEGGKLDRRRAASIPSAFRRRVRRMNELLERGEYPEEYRQAMVGRTTHTGVRELRLKFFRSVRA